LLTFFNQNKTMKHTLVLAILCCLIQFDVQGSCFRNYQKENGLSNNCVWAIMQDSQGFIWVGTNDGLNRFDGKNFKVYKNRLQDSLSIGHNFIHCIKEDSKHRMLIGTRRGLYYYDREYDHFHHIALKKEKQNDITVNDIMEDSHGNILIATHGEGLFQLDNNLRVLKHFVASKTPQSIPSNFIWTIVNDQQNNIWLGTAGYGLVLFSSSNDTFTPIKHPKLDVNKQSIYSIYCDEDNNLWIGTFTNGLFKYNPTKNECSHYLSNIGNIKSITPYSDKELIMGSDKGLILLNKSTESFQIVKEEYSDRSIVDNSTFCISRDKEGAFWVGTYFNGVTYFAPNVNKFISFYDIEAATAQKHSITSSMVEDNKQNILLSTHNNNIVYRYNPQTKQLGNTFMLDYHNIQNLYLSNDTLYVSIYGRGVRIISATNGKVIATIPLNTIEGKSIFKTQNGTLIFALEEGGCAIMCPGQKLKRPEALSGRPISDMTESASGTIWFATHAYGLYCLYPNGEWQHFSDISNKIDINNLSCLLYNREKNDLWIGTKEKGVIVFNIAQKKIKNIFNLENGMPSDIIYSIIDDKYGNIWISTPKGLAQIVQNSTTEYIKTFGYIGQEIQYNFRCALRGSAGLLYFGGTNGFISINPSEFTENNITPPIHITSFKVFNEELPIGQSSPLKKSISNTKEIVLSSKQSTFSFDFIALSYIFPETNKYAYMLKGFDKNWNYTSNNTAYYMNIPPGKYTFTVKGSNNNGIWNNNGYSIALRIRPPFWQEYYMIILYIILCTIIVSYVINRYKKHLIIENEKKQYRYQVAKEKETYEAKINFFTNIAHEIKTPLSLITGPLEMIIATKDGNMQTQKYLSVIKRNTDRLLILINQLLDFRKIENDMFILNISQQNITQIVQQVYNQYKQSSYQQQIKISFEAENEPIIEDVDPEALYKIVSNLVSNAVKFTKTQINIKLQKENDSKILISIIDDGNGIRSSEQQKIFLPFYQIQETKQHFQNLGGTGIGLSFSKALARKLGGDIQVQSEYGKGSIFTLVLPANPLKEKLIMKHEIIETEIPPTESPKSVHQKSKQVILIVEDNAELRTFINDCLSDNYTVLEAKNGVEAMSILNSGNMIDIIVSDILMPEMDGLELCNQIKSNISFSHLPLILLSAKTDTGTKINGLKKGADVYMEKPFSIEQLKAQINSVLENRHNIHKKFIESPLEYYKLNNETDSENALFIKKLNELILENMSSEEFSIDNIASDFAISRTSLHNKIKSITGVTPNNYIKLIRLNKSAELLATGKYRINEVRFLVGFNSASYFAKCFYEQFGKFPKDFTQDITQ